MSDKIFLFGNGLSRKDFDITSLKAKGLIVGCNEAYKDYTFDIVCSSDPIISKEIAKNWKGTWIRRDNLASKLTIDTVYLNDYGNTIGTLPVIGCGYGWDTGRTAIYALHKLYKSAHIYLFGFDLGGQRLYSELGINQPKGYENCWNFLFNKIACTRVGPVDSMREKLSCQHLTYEEFENAV